MPNFNVNDILGKLNELKAVFVLGQRALPFIEEIFYFLKEVAPLLEEINASMMDSALKMPHATSQLQNISEATKTATTEILDLIDVVLVTSQTYEGSLEQTLHDAKRIEESDTRLMHLLREHLGNRGDVIAEVEAIMEDRREIQHNIEGSVHARRTVVEEIRTQMNRIGNSLQVQDITTQQIASVTHLLDSMRTRMSDLLERLDAQQHGPAPETDGLDAPSDAAYDPHARYDRSEDRQQAIDDVFRAASAGDGAPSGSGGPRVEDDDEIERIFRNAAMAVEARRRQERNE